MINIARLLLLTSALALPGAQFLAASENPNEQPPFLVQTPTSGGETELNFESEYGEGSITPATPYNGMMDPQLECLFNDQVDADLNVMLANAGGSPAHCSMAHILDSLKRRVRLLEESVKVDSPLLETTTEEVNALSITQKEILAQQQKHFTSSTAAHKGLNEEITTLKNKLDRVICYVRSEIGKHTNDVAGSTKKEFEKWKTEMLASVDNSLSHLTEQMRLLHGVLGLEYEVTKDTMDQSRLTDFERSVKSFEDRLDILTDRLGTYSIELGKKLEGLNSGEKITPRPSMEGALIYVVDFLQKHITSLDQHTQELIDNSLANINQANTDQQVAINALQKALTDMQNILGNTTASDLQKLQDIKTMIDTRCKEYFDGKEFLNRITGLIEGTISHVFQQQYGDQFDEISNTVHKLSSAIETAKEEIADQKSILDTYKENLSDAVKDIEQNAAYIETLQTGLAGANNEITALRTTITDKTSSLEDSLATLRSAVGLVNPEGDDNQRSLRQQLEDNSKETARIGSLVDAQGLQIQTINGQISDQAERIQTNKNEINTQIEELEDALDTAKDTMRTEWQGTVSNITTEIMKTKEVATQGINGVTLRVDGIDTVVQEHIGKIETIESTIETVRSDIAETQEIANNAVEVANAAQASAEASANTFEELGRDIAKTNENAIQAVTDAAKAVAEVGQLQTQVEDLQQYGAQINTLQKEQEDQSETIAILNTTIEAQGKEIKTLQDADFAQQILDAKTEVNGNIATEVAKIEETIATLETKDDHAQEAAALAARITAIEENLNGGPVIDKPGEGGSGETGDGETGEGGGNENPDESGGASGGAQSTGLLQQVQDIAAQVQVHETTIATLATNKKVDDLETHLEAEVKNVTDSANTYTSRMLFGQAAPTEEETEALAANSVVVRLNALEEQIGLPTAGEEPDGSLVERTDVLAGDIKTLQSDIANIKGSPDLVVTETNLATLKTITDSHAEALSNLQINLSSTQSNLTTLDSELKKLQGDNVTAPNLSEINTNLSSLNTLIETINQQVTTQQKTIEEHGQKIQELQAHIQTVVSWATAVNTALETNTDASLLPDLPDVDYRN